MARMVIGNDNRYLIPTCCVMGAIYLLLIDTLARAVTSNEIPISILTAIIGAPLFATILRKNSGERR